MRPGAVRGGAGPVPAAARPLHGSPHRGNIVVTRTGIWFLNFETACTSPLEWDLAHTGEGTPPAPTRAAPTRPCWACAAGWSASRPPPGAGRGTGTRRCAGTPKHHLAAVKTLMAPQRSLKHA